MKYIILKWSSWIMLFLLALLMFLACQSCHRKQRLDPFDDVPDLPGDTVYITRLVDRCDYQYLSTNPEKMKQQLAGMIKTLDKLIIQNDSIIQSRISVIRAQQAVIRTFPEKDPHQGS